MSSQSIKPIEKKTLLGVLVACFIVQTALVYTDVSGEVLLEGEALRGAELWHEHSCQTCHQVYGFGGFLGPDLTNAATYHPDNALYERVSFALRNGPGQMPAFNLSKPEVEAIVAFLITLDATGNGEARIKGKDQLTSFDDFVQSDLKEEKPKRGYQLYKERYCASCHVPLETSPNGAPDLSTVSHRLTSEQIDDVLLHGRLPNMPKPSPLLTLSERQEMRAYFYWLGKNRDRIDEKTSTPKRLYLAELPWWEYP